MISKIAHKIVAIPQIYDAVQWTVGANIVKRHVREAVAQPQAGAIVIDIGAGTGLFRDLWPPNVTYICLDIDKQKLDGFHTRHPTDSMLLGDARHLPIPAHSVDAVILTSVAHHLSDSLFHQFLLESKRVLHPGGQFILMDPVWRPYRLPGRMLWALDRGTFPRTPDALEDAIRAVFDTIHHTERFSILHSYFLGIASPSD